MYEQKKSNGSLSQKRGAKQGRREGDEDPPIVKPEIPLLDYLPLLVGLQKLDGWGVFF